MNRTDGHRTAAPPQRPVIGVAAAITDDAGRVLLTKRGRDPYKGYWHLPGGAVEAYEELDAALAREFREELGIHIEMRDGPLLPFQLVRVIDPTNSRDVLMLLYHGLIVDGTPQCKDATDAFGWFREEDVAALDPATDPVLKGTPTTLNLCMGWSLSER